MFKSGSHVKRNFLLPMLIPSSNLISSRTGILADKNRRSKRGLDWEEHARRLFFDLLLNWSQGSKGSVKAQDGGGVRGIDVALL